MKKWIKADVEQVRTNYTGKLSTTWSDYVFRFDTLSSKDFGKELKDLLDWIYENKHQLKHVMGEYDLVISFIQEYDDDIERLLDLKEEAEWKTQNLKVLQETEKKLREMPKPVDDELLRVNLSSMLSRNPAKVEFTVLYNKIMDLANEKIGDLDE